MRPSKGPRAPRAIRVESMEPRVLLSVNPTDGSLSACTAIEAAAAFPLETYWIAQDALDGLDAIREQYGLTGAGQTVAVIDTGIAYTHTALGGGFGEGYRVVGGYDFAEGDADPYDDAARGSHGTHVAGILGSDDPTHGGIAPDVDLVALRVFDDAGHGDFAWVEAALRWVHDHQFDFENPITTVNLSIGMDYNGDTTPNWAVLEDELAMLAADGIFIAVAAGNKFTSYNTTGLAYPAVSQYVVPVSSVDADGQLSYYSQRDDRVIAAPGRSIQSTVPDYRGNKNGVDDDFATYSGTSMASPFVAAAAVLLRQAYEIAGIHDVTQADLVALMHSTADTVYDSITKQSYDRLNLGRAIDAIMPNDDYGSTADTAYAWGNLGQLANLNGTIENADDQDWFRFTAAAGGTAHFTVDTTQNVALGWEVGQGVKIQSQTAGSLTIEVVAGQTYVIGLSAQGALGNYTLASDFDAADVKVDWGQIGQKTFNNVDVAAAGTWFSATASTTGLFTVEALNAKGAAAGNVRMQLYDANQKLLADSGTTGRLDATVAAGTHVFLKAVASGGATVSFRATNLVSQNGSTVIVGGTSGNDAFEFAAGTTHRVAVGGASYLFSASKVTTIRFEGGAGTDHITLTGAAGNESADAQAGSVQMTGSGYAVSAANVETVAIDGGAGTDTLVLHGTAGDDTLAAGPTQTTMTGAGLNVQVDRFEQVKAIAQAGGNDVARFTDSAGNDTFVVTTSYAKLQGANYYLRAEGFKTVYATASGGNDTAYLRDTPGDDALTATPQWAEMRGSGYLFRADKFDLVWAYALDGGSDTAKLYDSPDNDQLSVSADTTRLNGLGFDLRARYFEQLSVSASSGGYDSARLLLEKSTDRLQASATLARLLGEAVTADVLGFDRVLAHATSGARRTVANDALDYVLSWTGYWTT